MPKIRLDDPLGQRRPLGRHSARRPRNRRHGPRSRATSRAVGSIGSSSPRSMRFRALRARFTRLFTVPTSQPHDAGHLLVGQALDADQHQHRPMIGTELGEGLAERRHLDPALLERRTAAIRSISSSQTSLRVRLRRSSERC